MYSHLNPSNPPHFRQTGWVYVSSPVTAQDAVDCTIPTKYSNPTWKQTQRDKAAEDISLQRTGA